VSNGCFDVNWSDIQRIDSLAGTVLLGGLYCRASVNRSIACNILATIERAADSSLG